jgi:hypothetical protein
MIIATGTGMTTDMMTGTQTGTATMTMKIGAIAETAIATEMRTSLKRPTKDGG